MARLANQTFDLSGKGRSAEYAAARQLADEHPGSWVEVEDLPYPPYVVFQRHGYEAMTRQHRFYIRLPIAIREENEA